MNSTSEPASADRWTLVRNARQVLTLSGASGPRSGAAMNELGVIPNGALLIRNGIIDQVGPSRRVENLADARNAHEIDATGRIVMPAFVDADVALVMPAPAKDGRSSLRLMSRRRALEQAAARAEEGARYGCIAVGAHTRWATDLQSIGKALRVHSALQRKPLRICSVFSPPLTTAATADASRLPESLYSRWLPAVIKKSLASVVELTVDEPESVFDEATLRKAATEAAALGYAIRLRSLRPPEPAQLQLALDAGAIAIVAPMDSHYSFAGLLKETGTVRVIPASEGFDDSAGESARAIRRGIEAGGAVALTTSYRVEAVSSLNMQHVLHVAVYRLGLSVEEAITATTWNAAWSLRTSRESGSLELGKPADLLVMDVPDYRELARRAGHRDASLVMREGSIVYRNPQPGSRR